MNEVPTEVKRQLVEAKLTLWRNTYYDASLDAEVAKAVEDPRLLQVAEENMKRALKAISALEKRLEELGS